MCLMCEKPQLFDTAALESQSKVMLAYSTLSQLFSTCIKTLLDFAHLQSEYTVLTIK